MKKVIGVIVLGVLLSSHMVFGQLGIVIDAERDDYWNTLTGPEDGHIYIPHYALAIGGPGNMPVDDADLSGLVWLGWDSDYFYAYFEVQDDIINVNNATAYLNDAVELKFDPDPTAQSTSGVVGYRLSAWGEDDAAEPAGVDNLLSGESAVPWTAVEGEDYARKEVETDDYYGYNLEFRIPWASIATASPAKTVDVEVGSYFGVAINIMDNDSDTREHVIQWSAGMADEVWSNPQLHGTVEFLEGGKFNLFPENTAGGTAVNDSAHWYIPPQPSNVRGGGNTAGDFLLKQNYPNPFNPSTTIGFSVKDPGPVKLTVFDLLGREIRTLVDASLSPGHHTVHWDGRDDAGAVVSSGIYIYRIEAVSYTASKKLSFIR
ncbi:MAG TPA: T9SS type A sorting domain-containing protein [bacterium]|nr:T9SS type A sorting domain-containing protein [bacterium]